MKKVVLVTGASSNLGTSICEYLSSNGYKVYGGYNSKKPKFNSPYITSVKLDITDRVSVENAMRILSKEQKRIDVLINCAGISKATSFSESSIEDFNLLLDVNVKGAYIMTKAVLPYMQKQRSGKVINISSMSGMVAFPNFSIYSSTKFALEGLANSLRYEVIKDNIWITNINPGAIKSESKEVVKMPHKTFREKFPIVGYFIPLTTVEEVAGKIFEVIVSIKPPSNVLVGRDMALVYFLKKTLPGFMWDALLRFIWR